MNERKPTIRVDKWLWYARFFKTRSLSAKTVAGGQVRVNSERITKESFAVGPGDTLTFAQGREIRVVEVLAIGNRRGPAAEAQTLYLDKSPVSQRVKGDVPVEPAAQAGRPTKHDRLAIAKFKRDLT